MIIQSGKHKGKTAALVILKYPDWVEWLIAKHPENSLVAEFRRLIEIMNKKPFIENCRSCEKLAVRASAYRNTPDDLYLWCDTCDPYGTGANHGKLYIVTTFNSALEHVNYTCEGRRSDKRIIIRELAQAKGLPERVGASQAAAFFT